MRRLLIVALIVLLGSMGSADALGCPDGCADETAEAAFSGTHAQPESDSGCLLCHGGLGPGGSHAPLLPGWLARAPRVNPAARTALHVPSRIDHPPRHA